ncbi:MAG: RnfABCDGE type electron transport complex subunit B [Planctomycetota bacterium]|nr:RnfABCDGE type electron transport complex subunit B [Planctomycetota bacterium]
MPEGAVKDLISAVIVMGGLGLFLGIGLALASKKFAVKIDPKIEAILGVLPGANCAGCGFVGCGSYAEAIAKGETPPNKCAPGGATTAEKIGEVMGIKVEATLPRVARVHCAGCISADRTKYKYSGIKDCVSAVLLSDGPMICKYGCVGMGSCVGSCIFGAMKAMPAAPPQIVLEKCVGCGACVAACPRKLIELIPKERHIIVRCASRDKGKDVKAVCVTGCITCMLCAKKKCKHEAIQIVGNIPVIDYTKCQECGECAKWCPQHVILDLRVSAGSEPLGAKPAEPAKSATPPAPSATPTPPAPPAPQQQAQPGG